MLLDARNVTKAFGAFKAVDDASVAVEEGEVLGLIGPNGAGKSTFFNCLTGDLAPTSGTVHFEGATSRACRRRRAPARDRPHLPGAAHVRIDVGARQRHDRRLPAPSQRRRRARQGARGAQRVGLGQLTDAPAKSLGTPGRKRLEIARALASEPKVLLLDEAMAGLTPTEMREAIELVRRIHGSGITLVIVEHIMEVIVSLAQRVVVFHQGREIARGTPREVTRDPGGDRGLSRPPQGEPGRTGERPLLEVRIWRCATAI